MYCKGPLTGHTTALPQELLATQTAMQLAATARPVMMHQHNSPERTHNQRTGLPHLQGDGLLAQNKTN
jgi:hypothetical protein